MCVCEASIFSDSLQEAPRALANFISHLSKWHFFFFFAICVPLKSHLLFHTCSTHTLLYTPALSKKQSLSNESKFERLLRAAYKVSPFPTATCTVSRDKAVMGIFYTDTRWLSQQRAGISTLTGIWIDLPLPIGINNDPGIRRWPLLIIHVGSLLSYAWLN